MRERLNPRTSRLNPGDVVVACWSPEVSPIRVRVERYHSTVDHGVDVYICTDDSQVYAMADWALSPVRVAACHISRYAGRA